MHLFILYIQVKQVVLHEMYHSLGFWHEHNRYDRDAVIKVIWSNVNTNAYAAFFKNEDVDNDLPDCKVSPGVTTFDDCDRGFPGVLYNLPYEYESIMHYNYKT